MISWIDNEMCNEIQGQEKTINLSNITKRSQFNQKLTEFFDNSNPKTVLLVYADMLNDSKNRINMCRSMINNHRLKRMSNKKPDEILLIKHVCFIMRIDQNKEDQSISFGKEWRQYTIDLLNGKGHTQISIEDLIKKNFDDLIIEGVSQEQLFQGSIVESMSKIFYNNDKVFILKRISDIQNLFKNEPNSSYLKDLIKKKLDLGDEIEA